MNLDNFKPLKVVSGGNTLTISKNGLSFSQAAIFTLGKPEYVKVLISRQDKEIAIQITDESDADKTRFYRKRNKNFSVRWNSASLKSIISNLMAWDLSKHTYKINGKFISEDNLLLFDLKEAIVK
ncbi:hypothetical protein [Limosilactobacillus caecicola]|uniref:hypothetical protein n=1 Tax=Limosilactobacillus caecicola TaxID=2941332 RepID=UPI00203A69F3|nr:hypothetical protein [Limosilactobacillus caecicola]